MAKRNIGWKLALGATLVSVGVAGAGCRKQGATPNAPTDGSAAPTATGPQFDAADQLKLTGKPIKGAENAVVTIVEYSDFQCPFCSKVGPTVKQVLESPEFQGKVRVIFKQYPLPFHNNAHIAGQASLAAHEQGKFWEMHEKLFANQQALTRADLDKYATELGLDMTKFKAALDGGTFKAAVDADMADGQKVGVQGTPNFLINGKSISGAQPFDAFAAAIREEITAMDGLMKGGKTMPQAFEERLKTNLAAKPAQAQNQRPGGPDPSDELFIPVGSSPVKGKADALITIAVISEFQCPFCKRVEPTLAALAAKYGDDVRFVFKHNPLPFHNNAEPAARAAWAAQQQGKFWEMHDKLFENQQALTQADLEKYASELGLNMAKFKSDMESQAAKDQVKEDQALATRVAARGTPHFFINGFRLRGAQPQAKFEEIIDRELQKAKDEVGKGTPRARVYDTLQADANKGEAKMLAGGGDQPNQPAAPRAPVVIPITDEPSKGPANAKVTIVEYTDFQCPFCSRFANNLEEAIKAYPNDVRVVVKQFPLGFHQNAQIAAEASLAAHAQGKFWEMYDVMWKNQQALTRPDLEKYAEQIGLNMARFKEALDKGTYTQKVKDQMAEGQKFGVSGTPSWFVNGVFVSGALPPDAIKAKIEEALKAPAAPAAAPR